MTVDIHLCEAGEIHRVEEFLERYWARGHVLAHCRALLNWQHRRPDGRYNIAVASRPGEPDLLGVLGFIPTSRYDSTLAAVDAVTWLALWKVRADVAPAGLGLGLLRHVTSLDEAAAVGVVGIGPAEHAGMYRALGFKAGELQQYYMLNNDRTAFDVAVVPDGLAKATASGSARCTPLSREALMDPTIQRRMGDWAATPRKTARYFAARFFDHPVYAYEVFLAESGNSAGLVAARVASHEGRNVMRLVDFLGAPELFAETGTAIQRLVQERGCEYADIWNAGFAPEAFTSAGFAAVDPQGDVVIPNYFEPFLRRNGRIAFALRSPDRRPTAVFRADGDQDRPNKVPCPA